MRQTKTIIPLLFLLVAGSAWAQTESKPAFGINFSGFIKSDMFYDSRQTVSIREGHFLLFPKGELADKEGLDLNAVQSLQMLSIQSRLLGRITGPDAFGAKTSGLIEAEFFGTSDADINGFRLRHAFVKMNWAKTELLVGQFWHPMFVTESFPEVVSFNTGAPFQPFNRSPQVRLTRAFGRWSLAASAIAQRDFASSGPDGVSTAYARNSMVPEFNLKLQYAAKNTAGTEFLLGAEGDILTLRPRTATAAGYAADATVASAAGMAFLQVKTRGLTFKAETVYGGNLHHLTMAGGYAVDAITDPVRGFVTYAPLRTITGWTELMTNGTFFRRGSLPDIPRTWEPGATWPGRPTPGAPTSTGWPGYRPGWSSTRARPASRPSANGLGRGTELPCRTARSAAAGSSPTSACWEPSTFSFDPRRVQAEPRKSKLIFFCRFPIWERACRSRVSSRWVSSAVSRSLLAGRPCSALRAWWASRMPISWS